EDSTRPVKQPKVLRVAQFFKSARGMKQGAERRPFENRLVGSREEVRQEIGDSRCPTIYRRSKCAAAHPFRRRRVYLQSYPSAHFIVPNRLLTKLGADADSQTSE